MAARPSLFDLCRWWRDCEHGVGMLDSGHSIFCSKQLAAIKLAVFQEISRLESQGGPTNDDTSV